MGGCVFCGAAASIPVSFLDTFTAYQLLQAGDSACERCAGMLGDAKFRRNCWYMQGEKWVKIDDALTFLEQMTQPPFVLYLTQQKRKHGWILAVQNPVLCKDKFVLVVDEEKILFNRPSFTELLRFCRELFFVRALPKWLLLGGYPQPSSIRRFGLERDICVRLQSLQRNRLWWTIVQFSRREKEDGNNQKTL